MLWRMQEEELQPNQVTYNACISSCEKAGGLWCRAFALVTEMRSCGVKPDVITYSSLISAVGKGLLWCRALALVTAVRSCGVKPEQSKSIIIHTCTHIKNVSSSSSIVSSREDIKLALPGVCHSGMKSIIIHTCTHAHMHTFTHSPTPSLISAVGKGLQPDKE